MKGSAHAKFKSSAEAPGPAAAAARGGGLFSRKTTFALGLALLTVATFVALRQQPAPDPLRATDAGSRDWWFRPVERNAFLRLDEIRSNLSDVFVLPGTLEVWAVGSAGTIVHSSSGGRHWEKQTIVWDAPPASQPAAASTGASPLRRSWGLIPQARAAENEPVTKKSEQQTPNESFNVQGQATPDLRQQTPEPQPSGPRVLTSIFFADESRGWAVGEGGTILATTDGGAIWAPQSSGTSAELYSVQFEAEGQRGWAVGDGGTILATTDGGKYWTPQSSGTSAWLSSVQFLAEGQRGWAVGGGGTILATTDGGAIWTPQSSGTSAWLYSVQFLAEGQRGWAVGRNGTILATTDGGATWTPQSSGTSEWLSSVQFQAEGRRGWAVGGGGTILATTDGGAIWTPQSSGTSAWLYSVQFLAEGQRGWAVGAGGTILATTDGGAIWTPQSSGTSAWLYSVQFLAEGQRGWAVGGGGTILATTDGGAIWTPQSSGTSAWLSSVQFQAEGQRGWAVGGDGTILATTDGGAIWTPQSSGTSAWLSSVQFQAEGQRGWAVGRAGTILATTDGGAIWTPQSSGTSAWLSSVQFQAEGQRGWAVGRAGTILATTDGGAIWTPQSSGTSAWLSSVQFQAEGQRGWAVGGDGTILATTDGGAIWMPQSSDTSARLYSVQFQAEGQRGWAVGRNGTILATTDGSKIWPPQSSGTSAWLYSVQFQAEGQRGWAVGEGGTILATTDGGASWGSPLAPYRKWPAPWFWLASAGLLLGFVIPALRRPEPLPPEKPSVADVLASDRPIRKGDLDPLDFGRMAGGVSRFLANESTEPPLTVAVTGEWGTGKSSLMNLIRSDLKDYGFPTVWFNVWHHQTQEHLLASLMEAIRLQAIPAWWQPGGLAFRARLLSIRGAKHWLPTALFIGLFAALFNYFLFEDPENLNNALDSLIGLLNPQNPETPITLNTKQGKGILALLLAVVGPWLAIRRGISTFGSTPSRLASKLTGGLFVGRLAADTGFQQRFGRIFRDVTRALEPTRMVIFLDDLDRCQPEKAVRALEMINFLVSSGDCYVIVGMAPKWVIRSVGLGFKEVAAEMVDDGEGEDDSAAAVAATPQEDRDERARVTRQRFATNYLEKLINIEVPLPRASDKAAQELLVPPELPAPGVWSRLVRRTRFLGRRYAAALVFIALVAVGFAVGPPAMKALTGAMEQQPAAPPTAAAPRGTDPGSDTRTPLDRQVEEDTVGIRVLRGPGLNTEDGSVVPGSDHRLPHWPAVIGLAALLALGLLRLSVQPKRLERDSDTFRTALDLWHPLVYHTNATPRSVKRFLNRVRYYAMCQRPGQERTAPWQRLFKAVHRLFKTVRRLFPGGKDEAVPPEQPPAAEEIPEEVLVALAAVQLAYPGFMDSGEFQGSFAQFLESKRESLPKKMLDNLDAIRDYPSPQAYLARFHTMSEGIEIRR